MLSETIAKSFRRGRGLLFDSHCIYLEQTAHQLSVNSTEDRFLSQLSGHPLQSCGTQSQTAAVITLYCTSPLGRRARDLRSQFVVERLNAATDLHSIIPCLHCRTCTYVVHHRSRIRI